MCISHALESPTSQTLKPQILKANAKIWIEFKGFETPLWRLKRRLWMFYGPGPLHVYKMGRGRIYLDEIITPQISKDDLLSIETI